MRVAIFGASGKVAQQAIQNLLLRSPTADWELILLSRNPAKVQGCVADVGSVVPLLQSTSSGRVRLPRVTITDDPKAARGANMVVIAAGAFPRRDQIEAFGALDPTGRLVQSYANLNIVEEICRGIADQETCPLVVLVTNQSDMMAESARRILSPNRVLGLGGIVDSARFRWLASQLLGITGRTRGHVIGYHSRELVALSSSLAFNANAEALAEILEQTRRYGSSVSQLRRDPGYPEGNSGAFVLPGYAVYLTIAAFMGLSGQLEEAYNVRIPAEVAAVYGTEADRALSVPVRIGTGLVEIVSTYGVLPDERRFLRSAQTAMEEAIKTLIETARERGLPTLDGGH